MQLAFFGHQGISDYFRVGGFESLVRRLATGLAGAGNAVDYILYGASSVKTVKISTDLTLNYFGTLDEAAESLSKGNYDHVFRVSLPGWDRLKYPLLVGKTGNKTRWHHMFLAWGDSRVKHAMLMLEGLCTSRYGRLICVSARQYAALKKISPNTFHLIPPVPESYFISPGEKRPADKIRVTFLGHLTKDKCLEEIIALFTRMQRHPQLKFSLYATHDRCNRDSRELHDYLCSQQELTYIQVNREDYSERVENLVTDVLRDTDVFVQPYRRLDNVLETPLLILEAMASLCAVITTPVGSVPGIYGNSRFIIPLENFVAEAENLLATLNHEEIMAERERIYARNQQLGFDLGGVITNLVSMLKG